MSSILGFLGTSSTFVDMYLGLVKSSEFSKITKDINEETLEKYVKTTFKNGIYKVLDPYFSDYINSKKNDVIFKDKKFSIDMKCKAYIAKAIAYFFIVHYEEASKNIPLRVHANIPILCKQMSEDLHADLTFSEIKSGRDIYDQLVEIWSTRVAFLAFGALDLISSEAIDTSRIKDKIVEVLKNINDVHDYKFNDTRSNSMDSDSESESDGDGEDNNNKRDRDDSDDDSDNDRDKKRSRKD